jgi:hypothetical protein
MNALRIRRQAKRKGASEDVPTKVRLLALAAAFSFLGGGLGTIITASLHSLNWERDMRDQERRSALEKRLELIDHTARVIESAKAAAVLVNDMEMKILQHPDDPTREALPTTLRLAEMNADVAATLQLDMLYFGPNTEKALRDIEALKQPWHKVDRRQYRTLMRMMVNDLDEPPPWWRFGK